MKPLATTQVMLMWACVCPPTEVSHKWQKTISIAFSVIVGLLELWIVTACAFLFLSYVSVDLEASLYPLFQMFGHTVAFYGFLYIISARTKIANLFKKLAVIYNKCKL